MGTSNLRQFGLLLWKNWLLQKRQIVLTVFQVFLPALFALMLLVTRTFVNATFVAEPTVWNSFDANTTLPLNLVLPVQVSPLDRQWRVAFAPNVSVVERLVTAATELLNNGTRARNSTWNSTHLIDTGVAVGQGELIKLPLLAMIDDQFFNHCYY
jgi:hypothetical protein